MPNPKRKMASCVEDLPGLLNAAKSRVPRPGVFDYSFAETTLEYLVFCCSTTVSAACASVGGGPADELENYARFYLGEILARTPGLTLTERLELCAVRADRRYCESLTVPPGRISSAAVIDALDTGERLAAQSLGEQPYWHDAAFLPRWLRALIGLAD